MTDISMPGNNRHPVDQLAEVRNTVKALKARESELVEQIRRAGADEPVG